MIRQQVAEFQGSPASREAFRPVELRTQRVHGALRAGVVAVPEEKPRQKEPEFRCFRPRKSIPEQRKCFPAIRQQDPGDRGGPVQVLSHTLLKIQILIGSKLITEPKTQSRAGCW